MTGRVTGLAACVLAAAVTAAAQTPSQPGAAGPKRELTVGAIFAGPSSMGSADAELLGGNGQPSVTLFSTQNLMRAGFGPEVVLGFRAGRSSWFEVAAGVTWADLTTRITDDFETTATETLSAPVTRWSIEGAMVWFFHDKGRTGWFVRAGGGVMGEVSSDLSMGETGFVGQGGVGVRHWWRTNGKGAFKRLGWRAEFRGVVQGGGISLAERTVRFAPTGTVHLVFGY